MALQLKNRRKLGAEYFYLVEDYVSRDLESRTYTDTERIRIGNYFGSEEKATKWLLKNPRALKGARYKYVLKGTNITIDATDQRRPHDDENYFTGNYIIRGKK